MKKKQQKKQTERFVSTEIKKDKMANEDYQRVRAFVIIFVIVIVLVGLLFLFNGKLVTKDLGDKETTTTTEPSFNESVILADNIFKQKDKEYMVLLFDSTDNENSMLFSGIFNYYTGSKAIYRVDLSDKMNKTHYNESLEEVNTKPTKASEVIVNGPTLLVIKDKEVKEFILDRDKIVEIFKAK